MLCVGARSWMVPRPWLRDAAVAAWRFGARSSVRCGGAIPHPRTRSVLNRRSHAEHGSEETTTFPATKTDLLTSCPSPNKKAPPPKGDGAFGVPGVGVQRSVLFGGIERQTWPVRSHRRVVPCHRFACGVKYLCTCLCTALYWRCTQAPKQRRHRPRSE